MFPLICSNIFFIWQNNFLLQNEAKLKKRCRISSITLLSMSLKYCWKEETQTWNHLKFYNHFVIDTKTNVECFSLVVLLCWYTCHCWTLGKLCVEITSWCINTYMCHKKDNLTNFTKYQIDVSILMLHLFFVIHYRGKKVWTIEK